MKIILPKRSVVFNGPQKGALHSSFPIFLAHSFRTLKLWWSEHKTFKLVINWIFKK